MSTAKIAFIGAGNMATAIAGGLVSQGFSTDNIAASDPYPPSLEAIKASTGIATYIDNDEAIAGASVVVLAVKPQVMAEVATGISEAVNRENAVVISIAAGITIASLEKWLGGEVAIVRTMPNTPALVKAGATGLYANAQVSEQQKVLTEDILNAIGITRWVNTEALLDAVTALSGSGPAYFFMFMEAMAATGVRMGLDRETSAQLAMQTGLGAAQMAMQSDVDLLELRKRVCSPGGTTLKAVESFESASLAQTVDNAMQAALDRAIEMAKEMG